MLDTSQLPGAGWRRSAGLIFFTIGKVGSITYGNGTRTDYDYYDQDNEYDNSAQTYFSYRLRQIQITSGLTSILNLRYDKTDKVKVKIDLLYSNLSETYTYDDLNRLIGKPHAVTNDGRYTYTYDANGNMATRSDGRTYTWDYDNRLTAVTGGSSFTYNLSGQRVQKTEGGVATYYFFGNYEEEYQGGALTKSIKYYFANNQRVAQYSSTDGLEYYHQDHLGSSVMITDASGAKIYRANYTPYGSDG